MAKLSWLTARLPEPYYLPTPSFGINRALGGQGLASGRIHLYWGAKASGKTTALLKQIAVAQSQGKVCAYIDAEKAFTPSWAELNGVDLDALKYIRANSAEQILELLLPDLEKGLIDVVGVDSLSSINFESYFDPDKNPMGSYARSSKMFTHKVLNVLGMQQHIILISHAAVDLSNATSGGGVPMRAAVGNAIDHWCSTSIKFRKVMNQQKIKEDGSFPVEWTIQKSKQSVYPVKGEYYFNPTTAEINKWAEVVDAAVSVELIEKRGAWYYYGEEKWQGINSLVEQLRYDLDLYNVLTDRLNNIGVEALEEDE